MKSTLARRSAQPPPEGEWVGPAQKSRFRVLRSEGDGEGPLEIEFENDPGDPGAPPHRHPFADEQFTVLEGRLELVAGGRKVFLEPGQSLFIPRGTPHTFRNADPSRPVRFRSVHTPGRRFERFLGSIYDLDLDGRVNELGHPSLLTMMALGEAHPDVTVIQGPPHFAQRLAVKLLGPVARLLGHRSVYRSASRSDPQSQHGSLPSSRGS